MLAKLQDGADRLVRYAEMEQPLESLLNKFGPRIASRRRPQFPFSFLRSDSLWDVPGCDNLKVLSDGTFSVPQMKEHHVAGGLPIEVHEMLQNDVSLVAEVVDHLLERFFPETWHERILSDVGFNREISPMRYRRTVLRRSSDFRDRILDAYRASCAICGLDLSIDSEFFSLEAAHIKPVCDNGPDTNNNGLALCVLHHKAFDAGAISLEKHQSDYTVLVSDSVQGDSRETLLGLTGEPIRSPRRPEWTPDPVYVRWHRNEYFRRC